MWSLIGIQEVYHIGNFMWYYLDMKLLEKYILIELEKKEKSIYERNELSVEGAIKGTVAAIGEKVEIPINVGDVVTIRESSCFSSGISENKVCVEESSVMINWPK